MLFFLMVVGPGSGADGNSRLNLRRNVTRNKSGLRPLPDHEIRRRNFTSQLARNSSMSDPNQVLADIARNLADALLARAKSRSAEDQKLVLALQTELVAEAKKEPRTGEQSQV
jgi:hypothetical protein